MVCDSEILAIMVSDFEISFQFVFGKQNKKKKQTDMITDYRKVFCSLLGDYFCDI